jgi:hypothetical protein
MGCCIKTTARQSDGLSPTKDAPSTGHHGVHELKLNYKISSSTKVLGAGSFGKVFLSENIADPTF